MVHHAAESCERPRKRGEVLQLRQPGRSISQPEFANVGGIGVIRKHAFAFRRIEGALAGLIFERFLLLFRRGATRYLGNNAEMGCPQTLRASSERQSTEPQETKNRNAGKQPVRRL